MIIILPLPFKKLSRLLLCNLIKKLVYFWNDHLYDMDFSFKHSLIAFYMTALHLKIHWTNNENGKANFAKKCDNACLDTRMYYEILIQSTDKVGQWLSTS